MSSTPLFAKEKKTSIFAAPKDENRLTNRNIDSALRFAEEDNTSRAIQEIQTAARYFEDLAAANKLQKSQENYQTTQKLNVVLHHLYHSTNFNSLEFPSLLDSLAKLQAVRMLTLEAVAATIQFATANIQEVKRISFETSNFRVVYHLFTLLWKLEGTPLAHMKKYEALFGSLREELIGELMKSDTTDSLQVYESINLMIAIMESAHFGKQNEELTSNIVYKILGNAFPKATDQSQLCLLMVILSKLPVKKPELVSAMSSTFNDMEQDKSKRIILSHFRKNQLEYLFRNLSSLQKVFPDQLLVILSKTTGCLAGNLEVMTSLLNFLQTKEDKLLSTVLNDELEIMLKLKMFTNLSEEKRLHLLHKASFCLTMAQSFSNFATRDVLLDMFAIAILEYDISKLDYLVVNDYLYIMVSLRLGYSPSILKIADRIVDKLSRDKGARINHLKLMSSFLSTEVMSGTHRVLDELALKVISIPDLSRLVSTTNNFRTFCNAVQLWHFKLWKELKTTPTLRVPSSFGLLADKMIQLFNGYMQQKTMFDSKTISKVAYTFDTMLAFGYFDDNANMKAKIDTLVLKLIDLTRGKSVFDKHHAAFFQYAFKDRYSSAEDFFKEALTKRGIKFEAEKQMFTSVVDFYLPDYDIAIELDGIVHLSRDSRRGFIVKTQLKKDYLRAKGVNLYNFLTATKDEKDKIEVRFNRLIDLVVSDNAAGVVRTADQDASN